MGVGVGAKDAEKRPCNALRNFVKASPFAYPALKGACVLCLLKPLINILRLSCACCLRSPRPTQAPADSHSQVGDHLLHEQSSPEAGSGRRPGGATPPRGVARRADAERHVRCACGPCGVCNVASSEYKLKFLSVFFPRIYSMEVLTCTINYL